jgi:hypothetical protein
MQTHKEWFTSLVSYYICHFWLTRENFARSEQQLTEMHNQLILKSALRLSRYRAYRAPFAENKVVERLL